MVSSLLGNNITHSTFQNCRVSFNASWELLYQFQRFPKTDSILALYHQLVNRALSGLLSKLTNLVSEKRKKVSLSFTGWSMPKMRDKGLTKPRSWILDHFCHLLRPRNYDVRQSSWLWSQSRLLTMGLQILKEILSDSHSRLKVIIVLKLLRWGLQLIC